MHATNGLLRAPHSVLGTAYSVRRTVLPCAVLHILYPLLAVFFLQITAAAEDQQPVAFEKRLLEVLDKKTSLNLTDATVGKLAATLSEDYEIPIELDAKALEGIGVKENMQFTFAFKAQPLWRGLERILSPHEMGYFVRDEMLVITSAEKAATTRITRLYDVNDLAPARPADPTVFPDGIWLASLVTKTVQPAMWEDTGGQGSIRWLGGVLVVSQSENLQHQVADLLSVLRAARDRQRAGDERPFELNGTLLEARRKLLDRRCHIDVQNQPLKKAAEVLQHAYGVPVALDDEALEDVLQSPKALVTVRYRNITLRRALGAVLNSLGLTYSFRDDTLVITKHETSGGMLPIVFYPVRALVDTMTNGTAEPNEREACMEELMELLWTNISPETWDTTGGWGSACTVPELELIVCSQSTPVQEEVNELLAKLRRMYAAQNNRDEKTAKAAGDESTTVVYRLVAPEGGTLPAGFARDVADVVRKLVAPDSWKDEKTGGWIGVLPDRLVVRHRRSIQREVVQLLRNLDVLQPPPSAPQIPFGIGLLSVVVVERPRYRLIASNVVRLLCTEYLAPAPPAANRLKKNRATAKLMGKYHGMLRTKPSLASDAKKNPKNVCGLNNQ